MAHLAILVIFYVKWLVVKFSISTHIYCIFVEKNSFFEMKIFKFVTWYANMDHIIWNNMVNIFSTFIKIKNHLNCFWNIFVFLNTHAYYICFHKYTLISHFINWNEIISFLISCLGYILI
jgi:hypothetical protein